MLGRLSPFLVVLLALASPTAAQPSSRAGVITLRVVEQGTSAPVADAQVRVVNATPPNGSQLFDPPREALTDTDGRYRFERMAPGRYNISINKTGYASPPPPTPPPFVVIEADRPTVELLIALPRGAVIAGRVLDVNGQPRADVRVMAMRRVPGSASGNFVPMMPPGLTNDLGEFRIHSLAAGEYVVQANPNTRWLPLDSRADAPAPKLVTVSTYYPGTVDADIAQPVTLVAGQTLNGVEIGLLQVPTYSIAGIVVDQSGRPLANAGVTIATASGSRISMAGPATRVLTEDDGSFKLDGLTSGTYTVNAAVPSGGGATSYTYITSNQVRVVVNDDHVTGLQLTAERP